jgi:hypothetical protein
MAKQMWKLLMTWDIRPGKEAEYFDFVVQEFVPKIQGLGIQPSEAWYTVWGNAPQILSGGITEERETIEQMVESEEWKTLMNRLLNYVARFNYKIVPAIGHFQL